MSLHILSVTMKDGVNNKSHTFICLASLLNTEEHLFMVTKYFRSYGCHAADWTSSRYIF